MGTELTTQARWYRVGARYPMEGSLGYDFAPLVGRFAFHTPATGARELRFASSAYAVYGGYYPDQGFQFLVTEESGGYENTWGTDRGQAAQRVGDSLTGQLSQDLMPNADYYLWIWPRGNQAYRIEPGSITVTVEGVYGTPSSISVSDGCFGGQIPVTLNVSTPGAVHDLSVSCAGRTESLLLQSSAASCVWEPELESYAPLLTDRSEAKALFRCQTYYGGNSVGSSTAEITLRFAQGSLSPTLTAGWARAEPDNSGTAAEGLSLFVQGFSKARVIFDSSKVACRLGADIAGFSIRCDGITVSREPYLTQVLSGSCSILCTVTDSRGQQAEETLSVSVEPYSEPRLTEASVFRCDSSGEAAEDGQYYSACARALFAPVGGENSISLTAAHRLREAADFGAETALVNGQAAVIGSISPDRSYEVRLCARDALSGSAALTVTIPTQRWAMKFRPGGLGVGFGKAPEHDRCIELPADWVIRIGNTIVASE